MEIKKPKISEKQDPNPTKVLNENPSSFELDMCIRKFQENSGLPASTIEEYIKLSIVLKILPKNFTLHVMQT